MLAFLAELYASGTHNEVKPLAAPIWKSLAHLLEKEPAACQTAELQLIVDILAPAGAAFSLTASRSSVVDGFARQCQEAIIQGQGESPAGRTLMLYLVELHAAKWKR